MTAKFAKYISLIGHPLLTIPIFVISVLFYYQNLTSAVFSSILLIFGIIVPLTINMYRGERKGVYTNFDISNQGERKSWYFVSVAFLAFTVMILFLTNQSRAVCLGFLLSALLLLASQLLNYYIKTSLHVSFNIFLSFLILPINVYLAALFFLFVFIIAWSRVYLRRHSMVEVITGATIGIIFGLLLQITV